MEQIPAIFPKIKQFYLKKSKTLRYHLHVSLIIFAKKKPEREC